MNIFGIFATPLSLLLQYLYAFIGNYGITLVILTAIVKLALYPLYKKQILSTAGASDLQPKMQELQRKYANDRQKLNEEMSKLYKEEGVNPSAGCLPMFVQMFVIMGLFALLRMPLNYLHTEEMYFAIHESFLWIKDLAQPDPWILPILSGIATFISFSMSQSNGAMGGNGSMNMGPMMAVMKYGFPIMIIWLAKSYPACLAVYWFISNFIQIFYNLRFRKIRENIKNGVYKKKKEEKEAAKKKAKRKPVRAGEGVRK